MKKSTQYVIFLIVALVLILAITVIARDPSTTDTTVPSTNVPTTSTTTVSTTTPNTTPTSTTKTYSLAEVATHSTQASCWTTIRGSVYDVTTWISKHPGGAQAITGLCGKDGAAFVAKHGGQAKPETVLAGFKIGVLK